MKENNSRRRFIKQASRFIGLAIGILSFRRFFTFQKRDKKVATSNIQNAATRSENHKILIAYESKFGSTEEIAQYIGKSFPTKLKIDIKRISEVTDLADYEKVIIGSAIQYDKWMPEANNFIIKNEQELATKSVSLFLVCLVLSKQTTKAIEKANGYAAKTRNLVPNLDIQNFGKFAGVLDYSKMSFAQRTLAKGLFAIIGVKEGDYRDWDKIKKWSEALW